MKNRLLRLGSAAAFVLMFTVYSNASVRFTDEAEGFKTYIEVCSKIDQAHDLDIEFNDIEKASNYCAPKIKARAKGNQRSEGLRIIETKDKKSILNLAKEWGFGADERIHDLSLSIHEKSPDVFSFLLGASLYKMTYEFVVKYRDVFSTVDVENAETIRTTANGWINEIKTQAREHVKEIGEVIYALFLERDLQAKQISKATRIIESFKEVAPEFREELQTLLHDTAHKKRTFDPIAAERLIVYREMADALFECDDI